MLTHSVLVTLFLEATCGITLLVMRFMDALILVVEEQEMHPQRMTEVVLPCLDLGGVWADLGTLLSL
jgi:hypothetical protein